MAISENDARRLAIAVTDTDVANRLADAVNAGQELAAAMTHTIAGAIVATNVSQTTDFGALRVGDIVLMIPATAGNSDYIPITTAGNLGQAAVVGNLYLVLRARVAPTASAIKL